MLQDDANTVGIVNPNVEGILDCTGKICHAARFQQSQGANVLSGSQTVGFGLRPPTESCKTFG